MGSGRLNDRRSRGWQARIDRQRCAVQAEAQDGLEAGAILRGPEGADGAQEVRSRRLGVCTARAREGDAGTSPFVFTVSLEKASALPVTVNYATVDGTANAAAGAVANTSA